MGKKKLHDLQISELLLVKAGDDWNRTFMASIKREFDNEGNPIICGEVVVEDCKIWSLASNEEELCKNLDELCFMILEYTLYTMPEFVSIISDTKFYLN
jgi:hypothetical protein